MTSRAYWHQRQRVRPVVLRALRRDRPNSAIEVKFTPAHAADFPAPGTGEDQELDHPAVSIIAGRAPDRGQFLVTQYPRTWFQRPAASAFR